MVDEIEIVETPRSEEKSEDFQKKPSRYKQKKFFLPVIIFILLVIASITYYNYATSFESTDDAYIEGHNVQISPKVAGNIIKVYIDDNQHVKKGQLLAEIDSTDYQVKYDQALAKLQAAIEKQKSAKVNVDYTSITSGSQAGQAKAGLEQASHNVTSAKAQLNFAQTDFERYTKLYKRGVVSKQDFDKVSTSYKIADENFNIALKVLDQAIEKNKGASTVPQQISMSNIQQRIATAEIKQLKSEISQTKLNISYTKLFAPTSGYITSRSIEPGAYVQIGQPLLSIVPEERWIIANFKETQLTNMRIGQSVNIKVDAYPLITFKGKVESFQQSTGSKASLFPPENAVGSFVKVVQRVPVKIVFTDKFDPKYAIVPGMSVIPEVKVK